MKNARSMPVTAVPDPGSAGTTRPDDRYARIMRLLAMGRCVMLDGANGTELIKIGAQRPQSDEHLWGLTAIIDSPERVKSMHRNYVDVGCDVISTNTWGLPTALRDGGERLWESMGAIHWMDVARDAVGLARTAAVEGGRGEQVAVAFSINGEVDTPDGRETIRLLARAFEKDPPDLILLETLIIASLYQMPVDPFAQVTTHRPLDYWGRNLLDHLIRLLPDALAEDGTAYIMQLSIIGERRTVQLLGHVGLESRVVDFGFFEFNAVFDAKREQIARVEEHSDAYHLKLGNSDTMVAYLIEVRRKGMKANT